MRAFQRAVQQDKVVAVIGSYISEVALAIEPWSARLHMPFITPGAASNEISKQVHKDYDHFKYTFHGWMTSAFIAQAICDAEHDLLVEGLHMKTAVIMSEDAAWTKPLDVRYQECLPKAGLQVLDHIRFNPDTTDFTPIFHAIEAKKPDVIITGISHVGVQPTVQWHDQQVPIPMAGQSSQATTSAFWGDTNGAAEGVITATAAAPGRREHAAHDARSRSLSETLRRLPGRIAATPAMTWCYIIAEAMQRAGSTDPGQAGGGAGEDRPCRHRRARAVLRPERPVHPRAEIRPGLVTGITLQWQDGKQVALWPASVANGKVKFPAFVKLPQAAN